MQVRKLIRLLTEMVEKEPKAAYMRACVDRRYATSNPQYTFIEIPDVEVRETLWEVHGRENESDNTIKVVVLGNY